MPSRVVTWLSALFVLAAACSAPSSYERFVKAADADGHYCFTLDMADSLSVYDIYLYTRVDVSDKAFGDMGDIPVDVTMVSPSGTEYFEKVYIPKGSYDPKARPSRDYESLYRKASVPVVFGRWKLYLSVDEDRVPGLCGMGVRLERVCHPERSRGI